MLSSKVDVPAEIDAKLNTIKHLRSKPYDALAVTESLLDEIGSQPNYLVELTDLYIETGIQFLELCVNLATEHERAMERSLTMLSELDGIESPLFARFSSLVGVNFIGLGQYDEALHYINHAYQIQLKHHVEGELRSATEGHLGIVHTNLQNHEQAIQWHEKSLETAQQCDSLRHITAALLNLCQAHYSIGEHEKAIEIGEQCVALAYEKPTIDITRSYAYAQDNIGDAWMALGEVEKAIICYEDGLQTSRAIDSKVGEIYALYGLSQVAQQREQSEKAITFLENALTLAEEIQSLLEQSICLELLAEVYESAGQPVRALQTYKRYKTIYQTMFNQKKQNSLHTLEIIHRTQIAQLEAQIMRDRNKNLTQLVSEHVADLEASLEREKRLAHELQDALDATKSVNALRAKILKTISHEFRTPLTVLSVSSKIVQKRYSKLVGEEHREQLSQYHAQIKDAILFLTQIIDGIVEVEQINQAPIAFQPQMMTYQEACIQIRRKMERQFSTLNRLHFNFKSPNERVVWTDRKLLARTLILLVDNAQKYSEKKTPICVTAELDQTLTISIQNEGMGILPNDFPHIWELFYRGETAQYAHDGLGLGLFMAKHLVETMQGEITATSSGEGHGATFTVRLPISQPQIELTQQNSDTN